MVVNQHIPAPQLSKVSYLHPSNSVKPNLTNRNLRNDAANDKLLSSKIPNPKEKVPLIKSGIKNNNIHPTMTRVPVYSTAATRTNTTRMVKVKEPIVFCYKMKSCDACFKTQKYYRVKTMNL